MTPSAPQSPADHLVSLERAVDASPDTVWRILSTPELFSAWMEGAVHFEGRKGSPFRADFEQFGTVITGEIVSFDPSRRHIAMTWGVESGPQAQEFPPGSSVLDLRVEPRPGGCTVSLVHSRFPTADLATQHEGGWRFHVSRLALRANRSDLEVGLGRTLPLWIRAWNETDPETRRGLLEQCCSEDVEFRDDWATLTGIADLGLHIGNCQRFVPGWFLEDSGALHICRGEALAGWRTAGPGGRPAEGVNHVRARPDGTILRVTGFSTG